MKLDLANDCVTVRNEGRAAVPLTGWQLHSLTGGQHFAFPDGTTLAAGATVSVWSGRQGQQRQQAAEDDVDDEGKARGGLPRVANRARPSHAVHSQAVVAHADDR